jgi:WGR domain
MTPVQTDIEDWLAAQEARLRCSVRLCRIDPDKNMARFYRLAVERDLFGMWCLIRKHPAWTAGVLITPSLSALRAGSDPCGS